jgi:hypothetical protein
MNVKNSSAVSLIRVFVVAIPSALLLLGLFWVFAGRNIPDDRAQLYQNPVYSIQEIRLLPANNFSLVDHEVVITNASAIQDIMAAIRSAKKFIPNHPATRWECILEITGQSGISYVDVLDSPGQDTILHCQTSQNGFIFDTLQSSTLNHILEQVITNTLNSARPSQFP